MPINEAIERAHREGILTAASLMVAAPAAADAMARARRTPSLRVGLHVVVARGAPALPREEIRALVDADGKDAGVVIGIRDTRPQPALVDCAACGHDRAYYHLAACTHPYVAGAPQSGIVPPCGCPHFIDPSEPF